MPRGREAIFATVEESVRLDLAEPAVRKALAPGRMTRGAWTWSSGGAQTASLGYDWFGQDRMLLLRFSVAGAPVRQTIRVTSTTPRVGGERFWFACPSSGLAVRALFLPPGGRRFASRRAWRLVYQSTRDCSLERALLRQLARTPEFGELSLDDLRDEGRFEARHEAQKRRNAIRRLRRAERATK